MGMFKRLRDILTANLDDAMDACENPEPMLRQAIREMELAVAEARRETARAMAAEKLAARELADSEQRAADYARRAEQAVQAGDDAAARKALTHKQEQDRTTAALRDQATAAQEASGELRRQLEGMQAKLAEANHRLGTLVARNKAAAARLKSADPSFEMAAFDKFNRMSAKVARAEAEAEAMAELHGANRAAAATAPPPPASDADVEAALAELKRKAGK